MKVLDDFLGEVMARARAVRDRFAAGDGQALGALLSPAYARPQIMKIFDPIVAVGAAVALLSASALGFGAFGVLVACALIAYLIITQVFGISVELNPEMFQKFTQP
jgi:hypothetical protein